MEPVESVDQPVEMPALTKHFVTIAWDIETQTVDVNWDGLDLPTAMGLMAMANDAIRNPGAPWMGMEACPECGDSEDEDDG